MDDAAADVFRVTVLGAPQTGKTTLVTTCVAKSAHATAKYVRTRRNETYFARLGAASTGGRGSGSGRPFAVQLQDTPGGVAMQPSHDEVMAIRDETRPPSASSNSKDAAAGARRSQPRSSNDDYDDQDVETARLLGGAGPPPPTRSVAAALTQDSNLRLRSLGFIVMFDCTRRDSFDKARTLISNVRNATGTAASKPDAEVLPIVVIANKRDLPNSASELQLEMAEVCRGTDNVFFFAGSCTRNEFVFLSSSPPLERGAVDTRRVWSVDDVVSFLVSRMRLTRAWVREHERRLRVLEEERQFRSSATSASRARNSTRTNGGLESDPDPDSDAARGPCGCLVRAFRRCCRSRPSPT